MRGLLVEDNRADVNLIQLALKRLASDLVLNVVDDGVKALEYLRRQGPYADSPRPDFILLDLKLPRRTGLEVLARVKQDPGLRRIPVIVLTSSKAASDVGRAYDLQVAAYFVKPVSGLEDTVEAIIRFLRAALLPGPEHAAVSAEVVPADRDRGPGATAGAGGGSVEEWSRARMLETIVDGSSDPIISMSLEGTITSWNQAAEALYGHTSDEAIGRNIQLVVPEENMKELEAIVRAVRRGEAVRQLETVRVDRAGRRITVSKSASPIRDGRGEVVGISLIARDMTERSQEEDRLRIAAERSPNAIVMVDATGRIILVNAETERLFGYARTDLLGKPVDMLVPDRFRGRHPGHRADFMARPEARAMGAGRELFGLRKDGSEFPIEIGLNPIETESGRVVLSAIVDITERKQAEERFRLAVESAPNAMVMVDASGTIVLVNAETERLFGYVRAELLGKPVDTLVPERFRAQHPGHRSGFMARPEARAMGAGRELFGLRKDGTEFPVEIGLNPIRTESGTLVLSAIVDITERRQAEERFRLAVESSPSAMVMIDATGSIVLVNAETERLFGYPRKEIVGKAVEMLVPGRYRSQHPQLRTGFLARPEARAMGAGRELFGLRKDGTEFPVEIGLTPIKTTEGTLVLSAIVDITERKRSEEALALRTRELARSNAELEQFAYVASHDLQEPLRTVASYTRLLATQYADRLDEDGKTYVEFAREGAIRMQSLIEALLAFSRVGTRAREPIEVDSGGSLQQALENLRASVQEAGAEVVTGDLPTLRADPIQLTELFQNLVGNAIKFRGAKPPRVEIEARRNGSEWIFSVADNGIGIDSQFFDRIFQVFQRLHGKEEYPGTGIGLAICKRIVERMGGRIWVESSPGNGTTFSFTVPVAAAKTAP